MEEERRIVAMTTLEIADIIERSPQQVRNLARVRGWKPVRQGKQGRGQGSVYNGWDVVRELQQRIAEADSERDRFRQKLEELEIRLSGLP